MWNEIRKCVGDVQIVVGVHTEGRCNWSVDSGVTLSMVSEVEITGNQKTVEFS
jgi:hypothetical protein